MEVPRDRETSLQTRERERESNIHVVLAVGSWSYHSVTSARSGGLMVSRFEQLRGARNKIPCQRTNKDPQRERE